MYLETLRYLVIWCLASVINIKTDDLQHSEFEISVVQKLYLDATTVIKIDEEQTNLKQGEVFLNGWVFESTDVENLESMCGDLS